MRDAHRPSSVLITGGQGALGHALAGEFQRQGWNVRNPGRAELDVTSAESVDQYFRSLSCLDVLINNAGRIEDRRLTQLDEKAWDSVLDSNLRSAFLCTRRALPLLQAAGGGQVLFVGSRSARFGAVGQANYAAAKAGLLGLAQSLAQEGGASNLRCNVIFPGFLETPMTADLTDETRERIRQQHVLGRFNTVDEAARFMVFLAGMKHVSGQFFQLDSRLDPWT